MCMIIVNIKRSRVRIGSVSTIYRVKGVGDIYFIDMNSVII